MGKGFLLGLFGVFAILSYGSSYLEPVIRNVSDSTGLHWCSCRSLAVRHALSMPSMMGFVSLAGIVVNDSILLVQYIFAIMSMRAIACMTL